MIRPPVGFQQLPLLTALFLAAFFRHGKSPLSCLGCENSSARYRVASAAWHVSSHVTERLASVLTLFVELRCGASRRKRAITKKEGVRFLSTPGTGGTAAYRFLPPFFFPPFFAILPP
jgi:hypothetical protein